MLSARIVLDRDFIRSTVDDRLFGSFIEHLGRAVYGGIPARPVFLPLVVPADRLGRPREILADEGGA